METSCITLSQSDSGLGTTLKSLPITSSVSECGAIAAKKWWMNVGSSLFGPYILAIYISKLYVKILIIINHSSGSMMVSLQVKCILLLIKIATPLC